MLTIQEPSRQCIANDQIMHKWFYNPQAEIPVLNEGSILGITQNKGKSTCRQSVRWVNEQTPIFKF